MRLVSWNVNGLRAVMKKGFMDAFHELDADVFALQETKLQEGQIEMGLPGYHQCWSYAERKGYSGTAVFCKEEPLQVIHEVGVPELDTEGRVVICEFEQYWFVNVYTPNAQSELARLDHRMAWDDRFRDICKGLEEGVLPDGQAGNAKPVVMCGDFNVAHQEIDLKNPRSNRGNPGFSDEERAKFTCLLDAGFIDTFRYLNPATEGAYSWWSYRFHARANNAGWRIDYFLVSEALREKVQMANIYSETIAPFRWNWICRFGLLRSARYGSSTRCGGFARRKNKNLGIFATFLRLGALFSSPLGGNRPQYGQLPAFLCRDSRLESLEQLLIAKKLQSGPIFCFWAPGAA